MNKKLNKINYIKQGVSVKQSVTVLSISEYVYYCVYKSDP